MPTPIEGDGMTDDLDALDQLLREPCDPTDRADARRVLRHLRARLSSSPRGTGEDSEDDRERMALGIMHRSASRLADAVDRMVESGHLSSRSPAADALLDYRDDARRCNAWLPRAARTAEHAP